jgi:hypothetical protein
MKGEEKNLQDIPMLWDFSNVVSIDYVRLSPQREVEFRIECVQGTNPMSKVPHRMTPAELKELKERLQELLELFTLAHCRGECRCCL